MSVELTAVNPMGIGHTHELGEWMIGYQFRSMWMEGNRDGTNQVSNEEVLEKFPISPTDMTMRMHMFEFMYGLSESTTLMVMPTYKSLSMNHLMRSGTRFVTETEGLGDAKLKVLYSIHSSARSRIHATFGLSIPTGSIDQTGITPMGKVRLPYPMQLGSGTYDILPGITVLGRKPRFYWGAQAKAAIRLGENENNYTLGNRVTMNGWVTKKVESMAEFDGTAGRPDLGEHRWERCKA